MTGDAIVAVAVWAVPSKFGIIDVACALVACMVALMEFTKCHGSACRVGAGWCLEARVGRGVDQVRVKRASGYD